MDFDKQLSADEELDLFLVAYALRPSAIIDLPFDFKNIIGDIERSGISYRCRANRICDYFTTYFIGARRENIERMINAKTNRELGLALGYPQDAVDSFLKVIDGERREGNYRLVCQAKAVRAGVNIPSWLAYVQYIPANLDIVKKRISSSCEAQGKWFQEFTWNFNPQLAQRVEQDYFNNLNLPTEWELMPDGSYKTIWRNR